MKRRTFIKLLGFTGAAWPFAAHAQQPERMRRIGVLMDIGETDANAKGWIDAFETQFSKAGWQKGRNWKSLIGGERRIPNVLLAMLKNCCNQHRTLFWCMEQLR